MKKVFLCFLAAIFFSGCATSQSPLTTEINVSKPEAVVSEQLQKSEVSSELQNIIEEKTDKPVEQKGIIFAKTAFFGVLETSYVKLIFENQEDVSQKFQIYIGDKSQQTLLWNVKTVKPGYFFIELPPGKYKISSVSIPVGSTLATEAMDIRFEVGVDAITYLGTLKMVGTKEKIKLGGVPVLKPGFEYTLEILDERDEGVETFKTKYPNVTNEVLIQLMQKNISPVS